MKFSEEQRSGVTAYPKHQNPGPIIKSSSVLPNLIQQYISSPPNQYHNDPHSPAVIRRSDQQIDQSSNNPNNLQGAQIIAQKGDLND
ncbi:hypothetical protein JTE90_018770 [Oedothorax gibbosus]|uniref:Uncharacterized protein n=1 Tax=Oedothorax gibbosus TaxID=931172 RepID=A0AAV6UWT9_9ARAC|nr:hypothetical protein JTE90_018770 [Oedothorax gibbosus]